MDVKMVKFVKSNMYYFNVENNIIYGKEKHSFSYFHELSHLKDHQNKFYRKFSLFMSFYNQFAVYLFIFAILSFVLINSSTLLYLFLVYYSIYASFIFCEEIRADIRGIIWGLKWKKKK